MNIAQVERAKTLIKEAKILSSIEKAEWIQLLSEMSDSQLSELIEILEPKKTHIDEEPHLQQLAHTVMSAMTNSVPVPERPVAHVPLMEQVNPAQKEISTSIPFYEKDLPKPHEPIVPPKHLAPAAASAVKTVPPPAAVKMPPPALPQIKPQHPEPVVMQQKITAHAAPQIKVTPAPPFPKKPEPPTSFETTVSAQHKNAKKPSNLPPPPIEKKEESHQLQKNQVRPPQAKKIILDRPEDLAKLVPSMFHGQDVHALFQLILGIIVELSKKYKIVPIVQNLEQSQLYACYLKMGMALLDSQEKDPEIIYARVAQAANLAGEEFLTKEEFEAFTDFRNEIDKIYL